MQGTELFRLVEAAIEERTAKGEMFTAFDITRALNAQGVPFRHGQLKQAVHALFEHGHMPEDYARTLCDIGGRTGPAWVYHRECDDPAWFGRIRDFNSLFDQGSEAG